MGAARDFDIRSAIPLESDEVVEEMDDQEFYKQTVQSFEKP